MELESDPVIVQDMKRNIAIAIQQIINEYKGDFILTATTLDPR